MISWWFESASVCLPLQDLGNLEWLAAPIRTALKVVMFVRNHHFTQALVRKSTDPPPKELLKPAETRFGTNLLMIERLLDVKSALQVGIFHLRACLQMLRHVLTESESVRLTSSMTAHTQIFKCFALCRKWW
jgi:hypothetical protein